ncbi:MAG: agmatine deiminase family protein [Bacteroidales bacterium]
MYFSSLFREWYPEIAGKVFRNLARHNIRYIEISGTKDIWCRDYLPVQVTKDRFIQFKYEPKYIRQHEKHLLTNPLLLYYQLDIDSGELSNLIVDGGQVIKGNEIALVSERAQKYWNKLDKREFQDILLRLFEVKDVIIIPSHPEDFTGHLDGLVRLVDDSTVLVSDVKYQTESYQSRLREALGLFARRIIELPTGFNPNMHNKDSACGIYLNYLHVGNLILFPVFDLDTDDEAFAILKSVYSKNDIIKVNCADLAEEGGGILNCVSWNVVH